MVKDRVSRHALSSESEYHSASPRTPARGGVCAVLPSADRTLGAHRLLAGARAHAVRHVPEARVLVAQLPASLKHDRPGGRYLTPWPACGMHAGAPSEGAAAEGAGACLVFVFKFFFFHFSF